MPQFGFGQRGRRFGQGAPRPKPVTSPVVAPPSFQTPEPAPVTAPPVAATPPPVAPPVAAPPPVVAPPVAAQPPEGSPGGPVPDAGIPVQTPGGTIHPLPDNDGAVIPSNPVDAFISPVDSGTAPPILGSSPGGPGPGFSEPIVTDSNGNIIPQPPRLIGQPLPGSPPRYPFPQPIFDGPSPRPNPSGPYFPYPPRPRPGGGGRPGGPFDPRRRPNPHRIQQMFKNMNPGQQQQLFRMLQQFMAQQKRPIRGGGLQPQPGGPYPITDGPILQRPPRDGGFLQPFNPSQPTPNLGTDEFQQPIVRTGARTADFQDVNQNGIDDRDENGNPIAPQTRG